MSVFRLESRFVNVFGGNAYQVESGLEINLREYLGMAQTIDEL